MQTETYDLGASALTIPGFGDVELQGVVHHPVKVAGRHLPLVIFVHGMHRTCEGIESQLSWPCPAGSKPIPNHRGYDYVGAQLASHGYVVVSISANGPNGSPSGPQPQERTIDDVVARAILVQKHLDLWRLWSTSASGPFGDRFLGALDLARVGLMGHSRGGESVLEAVKRNATQGVPFGIKAVAALAPSAFERRPIANVSLAVLLPECDGDQVDEDGVRHFDDARYLVPGDASAKYVVYLPGANHDFFNTTWSPESGLPGGFDDFPANPRDTTSVCRHGAPARLTEEQQRHVGSAWISSFFRYRLGGEEGFAPVWQGRLQAPPTFGSSAALVTYHAPAGDRRDVSRLFTNADVQQDAAGGAVHLTGFEKASLCGGAAPQPRYCLADSETAHPLAEPHEAGFGAAAGASILALAWSAPGASFESELATDHRDLGDYRDVRFRAALDFADPRNPLDQPQNLRVVLTDGAGNTGSAEVSPHSAALSYPPLVASDPVWVGVGAFRRFLLQQVRIPLSAFRGVDLHDIRSIALVFDRTPQGALGIADLTFTR